MKISYYMHYTLFIFSCNDPRDFLATLSNALQFNYYQPNYSYRDMHSSVLSARISMYFFKFISPTLFSQRIRVGAESCARESVLKYVTFLLGYL